MERGRWLLVLPFFLLVAAGAASAQEAVAVEAGLRSPGFGFSDVVFSGGWLEELNWLGILGWSLASLPLGILSIVHCGTSRMRPWPLATKMLMLGSIWVAVLGGAGFVNGSMYALYTMSFMEPGAARQGLLALKIAQALWSPLAALFTCQVNLLFLLISMVIRHRKRRDIMVGP